MNFDSFFFNVSDNENAMPVVASPVSNPTVNSASSGYFAADWNTLKTQDITIEQLRQTNREMMANRQPMHGIYHYQMIDTICQMAIERGLQPEVTDLFAAKAGGTQYPGVSLNEDVAKQLGNPLDVRAYTLRRVYATIRIKDTDNGEMSTAVGLAYTQKGIQLAIGRYIHICHNQTILCREHCIQTFTEHKGRGGNDRITFQDCLDALAGWLDDVFHISERDDEIIRKMKATPMTPQMLLTVIGELTAIRVACDSTDKRIRQSRTYPLNNTQINDLTEDMLIRFKTNNRLTVWDLYDAATNLYKAKSMDFTQLMPQNLAMVEYLTSTFKY